jgi:hypothetical protein
MNIQETQEYDLLQQIKFCLICKNDSQAIRLIEKYGFQKQEESYSEEEVIKILIEYDYSKINDDKLNSVGMIKEWFEQNKNK